LIALGVSKRQRGEAEAASLPARGLTLEQLLPGGTGVRFPHQGKRI